MRSWSEISRAIATIGKDLRDEFKTEITDKVLSQVVDELIQSRLNDSIYKKLQTPSTPDLMVALEILQTDKAARDRALSEKPQKKRSEMN